MFELLSLVEGSSERRAYKEEVEWFTVNHPNRRKIYIPGLIGLISQSNSGLKPALNVF
jgi:hypothetical protein